MKLIQIQIENFRCFDTVTLDLDENLTVLVGGNGAGKTALLDALRIALWPFVKGFDLGSQTGKSATIQIDDVRMECKTDGNMESCLPSLISAIGTVSAMRIWPDIKTAWPSENPMKWVQWRERVKPGTTTQADMNARTLSVFGRACEKLVKSNDFSSFDLPLVSYFGTGRLWYQDRYTSQAADTILGKNAYSRFSGYLNCITTASSFKQFAEWYGWIYRSYREAQIIALEKGISLDEQGLRFDQAIRVVKGAVNEVVTENTGWRDIEYSAQYGQQLVLTHPDWGVLPLESLSDGLRNTIALVADLAFRAYKLNPHFGADAAKKTSGIALIDEVDMFLHPAWQQTVIGSLRRAFPEIQFVVTTHSPQVLSTVPARCIRLLQTETDPETGKSRLVVRPVTSETQGTASSDVLAAVMHIDPVPDIPIVRDLHRYHAMIQQNLHETPDGTKLREALEAHYGNGHPALLECDRLIRLQAFKNKLPPRTQ